MSFKPVEVLRTFDGGLNTKDFAENLEKNQSPYLRNVDFTSRTIRKAAGYTVFGTDFTTDVGFFLYNHKTIVDTDEVLIKTTGTQIRFYDEVSEVWQLLSSSTFTANKRWWAASFNGYMYGGNGTDNFVRWRGSSWGKLQNSVLAGAATIDLQAGEGARFAAAGSGLIEGDTFAWTGVSTDQLTGVTGLTSGHAAGARVITELDSSTYSAAPKGSVGAFYKNRILVRDDANPTTLYHSKLADNTTPQDDLANFTIAGSGSGDAGFFIFPAEILGVKTFITGSSTPVFVVACSDGILYSAEVTDTGGATVQTYNPIKVIGGDLVGKQMLTTTENDIVLIDTFNTIRTYGYEGTDSPLKSKRLSDIIEPTMTVADFTDGFVEFFNRRLFFQGKVNDAAANNYTVVKDTNPDAFTIYDHWQINAVAEFKNNFYGLSSLNQSVYKLFTGLNANGNVIASEYTTPQLNFGAPLILKMLRKIRISGFITSACNLYFDVYFDETDTPITFLINGDNTNIVIPLENVAVGTVVFSQGVFGGGLPGGQTKRRFFAELSLPTLQHFFTSYVRIRNNEKDVDFELDKLLFFADGSDQDLIKPSYILSQS